MKKTPAFKSLGRRLRWLRHATQMPATELGALAGLKSRTHVGIIERTKGADPRGRTILALADVFGVDPRWLVLGEGTTPTRDGVRQAVARARTAKAFASEEASEAKPTGT